MIARYTEKGWEIITQRAHGLIAAQLAFHWRAKDRPARWVETVLAIAEHDDAENELNGEQLLTSAGGPLNYDMNTFDLEHCEKLTSLTITKSRYIALLTSMHMEFLYGSGKAQKPEARTFLKKHELLRASWRKDLNLSAAEANRIYNLVEWCDALSLLICTEVIQPMQRSVEISRGPDDRIHSLKQIDEETLTITPWPFEIARFQIRYDYRIIDEIGFASSEDLRQKILAAPVREKVWSLRKNTKGAADKERSKIKDTVKK